MVINRKNALFPFNFNKIREKIFLLNFFLLFFLQGKRDTRRFDPKIKGSKSK